MSMSPEGGPTPEKKEERKVPAIWFADELGWDNIKRLEKMRWEIGPVGSDGSVHLYWPHAEDPEMPDDLKNKVEIKDKDY